MGDKNKSVFARYVAEPEKEQQPVTNDSTGPIEDDQARQERLEARLDVLAVELRRFRR